MKTPKKISAKKARTRFLSHIKMLVKYWANVDGINVEEKLDGLAFSILATIDGSSIELPAMDLVLRPHESDKDYCKSNGENWFEDGQVINGCELHYEFCNMKKC